MSFPNVVYLFCIFKIDGDILTISWSNFLISLSVLKVEQMVEILRLEVFDDKCFNCDTIKSYLRKNTLGTKTI